MSQQPSRRRSHNAVGVGDGANPPSVPSITRRSDSFQKDDAVMMANARQQMNNNGQGNNNSSATTTTTTDEFGFPLQQLRSSSSSSVPPPPHHHHVVTQKKDLEKVNRPSRLQQQQQQRRGHSKNDTMQQYHSHHPPSGPTTTTTSISRNNSTSSLQKIPSSKIMSSSSSSSSLLSSRTPVPRPPSSSSHNSFTRQLSNQSSSLLSHSSKAAARKKKKKVLSQQHQPPKIKISKPDPTKYKHYTFQHPVNAMRVSIRTIDLSHRIAFDTRISPGASSATLQRMLEEMDRVRGSRSTVGSVIDETTSSTISNNNGDKKQRSSSDNPCRISPSPNHMAILEFMHGSWGLQSLMGQNGRRVVRQLQWNAACSIDADPWFDGYYEEEVEEEDDDDLAQGMKNVSLLGGGGGGGGKKENAATAATTITTNAKQKQQRSTMRKKPKSSHGDGRYIPIDPITTTRSMLPDHSPLLTNVKRRLPMRSDVGFANPSPEEIAMKMGEVKKEAEWEEASPRIVLLASGFSLFEKKNYEEKKEKMDELHPSCRSDAKLWAGGLIPGVPFAGRDLVLAYKMNARFEKKDDDDDEIGKKIQRTIDIERAMNPRSYSVFAPPVDATFSSSHLWRPRPFMDRPPGYVYFLACPLDVRFQAGDVEPFFCTMALYSLPKKNESQPGDDGSSNYANNNTFCGKISEDFFFPAGDWNEIEGVEGSFDEDDDEQPQQSWRRRKRRAIMSYDPLEVSAEDLYLVIQVFKATLPNESESTQTTSANRSRKATIGSKIKRSLRTGKSREREKNHATVDPTQQMQSSSQSNEFHSTSRASFEEVGAPYLTPVCFSITPVFSTGDTCSKQESAPFFAFPETSESHDEFSKRLASLANPVLSDTNTKPIPIGGYTDVFTSYLGRDFTRALLDEPPQLYNVLDDAAPLGPQLLADVMGDCAISFDGPTDGSAKRQRSNLRRLPPSRESGYSSSFDLKEVLYFPPRSLPRKYEDDTALCASTVLNLLYVYPRLIRWSSSRMNNKFQDNGSEYMTLRVQVVEQELPPEQSFDSADPTYQALQAIYNPSSPAGPPLIESFFTKVTKLHVDDNTGKKDSKTKTSRKEIPMRDEVKVRLPDILDRRHFLQFSLFSVKSNADIELVAETTIPFIISSKESTSGGRVTTIVPNGLHRIQLSDGLQVHVETRISSSSHLSDPSVATLLRDYPILSNPAKTIAEGDLDSTSSNSDVIVHALSGFPFLAILTMAAANSLRRHFLSLLTMNMLNFANHYCPPFYFEALFDKFGRDATWHRLVAWEKTDPLLAIIRSLFEILDKTRTSYQERDRSVLSLQYQRLVKSFLDIFDEPLFTQRHSHTESQDFGSIGESLDSSHAFNDGAYYDEPVSAFNKPEVDRRTRKPKYQVLSPRNNINPRSSRSFSRRAFVATRSEQMKAEAELDDDDVYRKEWFDDDETVVTLGTIRSAFPVILETKSFTVGIQDDILQNSSTSEIQEETPRGWACGSDTGGITTPKRSPVRQRFESSSTPFSFASKRAEYMANRVNTMAQLVMAPCIAPSVDDMISGGMNGSPSSHSHVNGTSGSKKIRVTGKLASYGGTGNQNPFEPSSDAEEEGETKNILPYLRGNQSCLKIPPLVFQPMIDSADSTMNGGNLPLSHTSYLYEIIIALWVQAWTSFAASLQSDTQLQGSSNNIPTWPYELVSGSHSQTSSDGVVAHAFIRHTSFFLPLCLKSLGLRCAQHSTTKLIVPMTFLDDNHMQVLAPLVETIALGLVREAMSGSSGIANSDQMLTKALSSSDCVVDFLIGLFALLHPSQVASLVLAYFNMLQECENSDEKSRQVPENMNKSHLRRRKCAMQLRLHAVERLAVMPTFARLNFPLKFTGSYPRRKLESSSSWTNQNMSDQPEEDAVQKNWEKVNRFPQSFWLSEFLMNQCLSICSITCEMIIMEAKKQAKASKYGKGVDNAMVQHDLLRMESLAFHSILCAYELLIKRQAMDSRFQTIASSTRVAALFTRVVLQQSVDAVLLLARMDPNQKVRLIWLHCVLYILQEGPDAIIRDELRRFCNPEDNRINNFVHLLKLACMSSQYFIPGDDESLPVLSGLSKEYTQEAFNCLSASVILLIDECFETVSEDDYELESLGKSIFDILLHILTTPQSSVTLLRTLGGSAHALDKFGVLIFLKVVGNQLQHWGRIVLTMMNSTELSVRSMAVDFLVSLLGDIYEEHGSIESISLCLMSVLPEVVAREIALCSVSGLIKTMEDAESSLWPLRRALADVEETNPLDDDRVDPQLLPSLTTLCRTGQAIIDGVLVELRLRGSSDLDLDEIVKAQHSSLTTGFRRSQNLPPKAAFDADEESIFEAAIFFSHDTSLTQKIRWLYTLRDLHVTKRQWFEVAESLILCAQSLIKSLDYLPNMWRPTRFELWNDYRRSPWLSSVGLSDEQRSQGNVAVMKFANAFLEPGVFIPEGQTSARHHPSVESVCSTLTSVIDQMEVAYTEEEGIEDLACTHLEELLSTITATLNNESKSYHMEARGALKRVRAKICSKLANLTERDVRKSLGTNRPEGSGAQLYVRVILHGSKPERFKESTTIPTFFEWDMPSICRVSNPALMAAARMKQQNPTESWEECICRTFAMPLIEALRNNSDAEHSLELRTRASQAAATDEKKVYISIMVVQKKSSMKSRKFFVRHGHDGITEYTVAHKFPHALSRQRSLITSEIKLTGEK